jgi:hypothetical protein
MFATKPGLFSIGTIVVLIIIWSHQPVKLITSTSLNLIEHVIVHVEPLSESHVSFVIHVKLIFVLHVKIVISPNTFQQHLPLTFFQPKGGEMEIDEMPIQIKVQNPFIIGWIVTKEEQLTKINLGSKENLQEVKINVDLEIVVSYQHIKLLKGFKDIFA